MPTKPKAETEQVDPRAGASSLKRIFTSPNKSVVEQEKEIRFTRSAQASLFFFLGIICTMICIGTLFNEYVNWGPWHANFKAYWWMSLTALIPAAIFFRIGIHCIRHAYIILTPIGVELFPFWKPQKNLQVIFWSDIDHAEFSGDIMKLHYNKEETGGIVSSLKPIGKLNYPLLEKAISGRLNKTISKIK
jgi:hypothetical protein